ncbi:hypothetical protein BGX34_009035 [Mortierella sp. NVP85]|nr:hypothetical protein BGX34_009035 [Mortierella sp. NVP85]
MKLLGDGKYSQDKSTGVSQQKRMLNDATPKDMKAQAGVDGEGSKKRRLKTVANNNLQGVCDSMANANSSREPKLHFDVQLVRPATLTLAGFDVETAFRQLRERAVAFVNDENYKVLIKDMYLLL